MNRRHGFGSDSELSDADSIDSSSPHVENICEAEIDEADDSGVLNSDPEGPYFDEPLADEEWLEEYNREVEEAERRDQVLQNRFDRTQGLETW